MFSNSISDYKLNSTIKAGKFGTVYKANYLNTNKCIVIKKISVEQQADKLAMLCEDVLKFRQFKHTNIHSILHCFVYNSYVYMVFPFMCFGNCQTILENVFTSGFPEILIALIFRDIMCALMYIHSHHFVHGSLRAKNILLDHKKAVLSNFRDSRSFINEGKRAKVLHGSTAGRKENLNWSAPEILYQNLYGYTEKSDLYSIGITSFEMANGFQPFMDSELTLMCTEKIRGNLPSLSDRSSQGSTSVNFSRDPVHSAMNNQRTFSDDFHQYIEICLNKNPTCRWSAQKLMTHSFFKQCRNSSISDQVKVLSVEFQRCSYIPDEPVLAADANLNHSEDVKWSF
ncbi:putative serine/threonine-protein kinase STE20-like isoform X3 [Drosophila pseudoobscura]|uniref:Serine/threonine-protein kinase STE20-like isoform X3 n=1 Tax=Drosophila pseudoobscura pseudoobscura TaxID=46245 RepID=A0A6I8VXE0_DROPS|nr:putative serine/threonine-protein kinase STE20-like isoform X3 [Drosophila pseudoobscura]